MIAIIDYGMGNLRSVQKGFEKVGFKAFVTTDVKAIGEASGVVVPGVGAFKNAIHNLQSTGLAQEIIKAIEENKPFLGICLGLQLLFTLSEEDGLHLGFNVINGKVTRFPNTVKVPHIGWNQINKKADPLIFKDIPNGSSFYFDHSYYVQPEERNVIATTTDYGLEFVSSVWQDNLFAVQFHPEKSSKLGLQILRNFGEMCQGQKTDDRGQRTEDRGQKI